MSDVPLSLCYHPATPPARAGAYFLSGSTAAEWLEALAAWGKTPVRLAILPRSRMDRTPLGVLVIPTAAAPSPLPRGVPYVQAGTRLLFPADAVLHPPVESAELDALLPCPVHVLHPVAGLVGFAETDLLRVQDLLLPPPRHASQWRDAVVGLEPPQPLRRVEPLIPPTAQDILTQSDGIGSEPLDNLPKSPDESLAGNLLHGVENLAKKLGKWTGLEGKIAAGSGMPRPGAPGWLKSLGALGAKLTPGSRGASPQWMQGLSRSLDAARNRELHRLLHLLNTDPEEGLRHALPLSGLAGSRGVATPGSVLPPRNTDFSLSGLRGGGPADAWNTSPEMQWKLRQQYQELANRELRLGRHRRAAYIFAHLLGDLASAASALRQGRHFREAATLYQESLHNLPLAAECLEAGGLLHEAIALYQTLNQHEKVGDLYLRLEQTEPAHAAYRQEVNNRLQDGNIIAACAVLERKLHAYDEALQCLDDAWPLAAQAGLALAAGFHCADGWPGTKRRCSVCDTWRSHRPRPPR